MSFLISLEGNIGSGKESFVQFFKKKFDNNNIIALNDSIYNWENEKLLHDFYKDPKRWAFTLEIYSTQQKCKSLNTLRFNKNENQIILTKRSPISDKECFVKTCKKMEYMDDKEIEIYNEIFQNQRIPKYSGIIYLRSNVNKCFENIISKRAVLEKLIQFKYIQSLHQTYEEWITELQKEDIPVLIIDVEKFRDLDGSEKVQEELLKILLTSFTFLKKFLKSDKYYHRENKWTVVSNKRKSKGKINAF